MLDVLLVNVPQISLIYPPAATSLLKGICEANGYTASVRDFNLELAELCNNNNNTKQELDQYFSLNDHTGTLSQSTQTILDQYIDTCVDYIVATNPTWLGISVFTFQCQIFTKMLLSKLRPKFHNKIIVGGAGLSSNGIAAKQNDFGSWLVHNDLTDYYIRGEGDRALLELLSGNVTYPGINNDDFVQIDDLDAVPYPNYDDVINKNYLWSTGQPQIPVTSSRGCVRKCSFCDIHSAWKKYKYRSGRSVADEFIHHYQKYNVKNFWFTDSLINGSMKSFREFCQCLVDYYQANNLPDRYFNWGGQFIVRDAASMKAADYELAARAGMNGVAMGVESLSENVRDHMKKGFSNADMDFTLEQMHRNNMNCYFLMIVGYPTETQEDHTQGIEQFRKYQKYALDGTIYGVNLGTTASVDEGTPLYDESVSLGIEDPTGNRVAGFNWIMSTNPGLDFRERARRRIEMQEVLMDLGYTIWNGDSQLLKLKEAYDKLQQGRYKTGLRIPIAVQ
jgi:hypothetical protein